MLSGKVTHAAAAILSVLSARDGLALDELAAAVIVGTAGEVGSDEVSHEVSALYRAGRVDWVHGIVRRADRVISRPSA